MTTQEQLAAFQKGDIDQIIKALEISLLAVIDSESPKSRERSIIATKIEEAILWARQAKSTENFERQKRAQGIK